MDISDFIFSPGALQSFGADEGPPNAQVLESVNSCSRSDIVCFGSIQRTTSTVPQTPTTQYRAPSSYHSTFPASTGQVPRRTRRKFADPKRRAEVAQVRKQGSCMRCHWNKIPCSSVRPCMSCISCWVSLDARSSKLQWMGCVPFSWKTVNIYALDRSDQDYKTNLQSWSMLLEEQTELHFDELIQWDIDALSIDFARWMAADDEDPAATSRVGILSSMECQKLLHHYLDEDLCRNLRLLVKTSSLLYSREDSPHPYCGSRQLSIIRSSVGAKILKSLESALKSTALADASQKKLKGLFLVLLGMIIAITYTNTTDDGEARHELLRILAHHMIFIGERIGLLECDSMKQRLTENCYNMWNKVGNFEWIYENP